MLKDEMESYVRIRGRGLKILTYPYMGVRGGKNCQNHPYVIDEWPLTFYYVERRNGILRKNRGRGFRYFIYPYMGIGAAAKNCQNHPYVINEWPLIV